MINDLLRFRTWAAAVGHYAAVAAVDRYLAMLATEEYQQLQQGDKEDE